ncbi:Na+/H+ antiporter subunit E [Aquibacillus koreensis]|uniref:Na+/H+ antiporter subunit E n=1 Tax=Aquibacillus koreensis TaxID=279446 RepID=A0A9X3WJE3_9BACI|nr:Na+/H+ antiporter subunit E [Aquibacillus koreensis]MCT2538199.1 Na+/H+ antiporter subunit E [Aquibacillus koreensis]MDC3420857.1 Na+/H+ antiporter subunit E [Aquibacillus koreensis]
MALQILLNIGLAIIWMLLTNHYSFSHFVIGYIVGVILLYIFRRFLQFDFYMSRVIAAIKLLLIFMKEMILSNIQVAMLILRPKLKMNPGVIAYPTELKSGLEVTLLSSLITLTPGTLVMAFSDDERTIYIHTLDIDDKDKIINEIKTNFEKVIMEVTH